MAERVVVVGADAAGMSAAHQALRTARARGRELDVVALERTDHTSYSACGIPYWIAGDLDDPDLLVARPAEEHRALGVDLRLRTTAVGLDLAAGRVTARTRAPMSGSSVPMTSLRVTSVVRSPRRTNASAVSTPM